MERLPQGARRLAVQLRIDLKDDLIWSVLTDYENLSRFIPNLSTSRLLWRRDDRVGLEQVGCQQFCGLRFRRGWSWSSRRSGHGMLRFA